MRFPLVDPATAEGRARELLVTTQQQLGRVPNLYRAMANSPSALAGYLAMRGQLVGGVLDTAMRERLALLIAEENGCSYCVAAHTFRGQKLGLAHDELQRSRDADSSDPHAAAVLRFARRVMHERGAVDDAAFAAARDAGVTEAEMGEVVAHIALNVLSNYFNHVAEPQLDFPAVDTHAHA